MTFYMLRALDYTDDAALDRRMQVREEHFAYLDPFAESGKAIFAGAVLDDSGNMIGSTIIFNMPKQDINEYLEKEPYIAAKVWEKIEINEFKLGPKFQEKYFSELSIN